MTKKSILNVSKFLLAMLLVTGAMNVTTSIALAQEDNTDEVVEIQFETTEMEVSTEETTPIVAPAEVVEEVQEEEIPTVTPAAVSPEVEEAQQAAIAELAVMLGDASAIVNALPHLSDEEKAASIDRITQLLNVSHSILLRSTIEDIDVLMASRVEEVQKVVDKAIVLDAVIIAKEEAIVVIEAEYAEMLAQIDKLTYLTELSVTYYQDMAKIYYNRALTNTSYARTPEEVQTYIDDLVTNFESLLDRGTFDNLIAEINSKLDAGRTMIQDNTTLTREEKSAKLDAINAIVTAANEKLAAATTREEEYAILAASIAELEKFIGDMKIDLAPPVDAPVVPPVDAPVAPPVDAPVDVPVLTPVPEESVTDVPTLPNTGLDNSALFLSVTALMVGALTLVLALKRNRNV